MRKPSTRIVCIALAAAMTAAQPLSAAAGGPLPCVTHEESHAFNLRHLQSRFMVAALACNQQDAYNKFVLRFQPLLKDAGGRLIAYFKRTGGGQKGINQHVTDLANAAGLHRAEDPAAYCKNAWGLFWSLEQAPVKLQEVAASNTIGTVARPIVCDGGVTPAAGTVAAAE